MPKGVIWALALCVCLFVANQASAVLILNATDVKVNKFVGVEYPVFLKITNNETYPLYNITFEDNPYITFTKVTELQAGSSIVVNASVISDTPITTALRIRGFNIVTVGQNPQTWPINITSYVSVPTPCDFSITKGDSVQWSSSPSLLQNIELRQSPYGVGINTITTLLTNTSYTLQMPSALVYAYRFYVGGFSPGECRITVLEDSGPVNNPQLDAILSLNVNVTYEPTTVTLALLNTEFTMDFYSTQDGIMSVSNTGAEIAHSVHLEGDWLSFSQNDFSLAPGETKGLIFTIRPIITATNQTNMTHAKTITASGNFPTATSTINVRINHANIGTNASSLDDISYLKNVFCPAYPRSYLCDPEPEVVYKYINNASEKEVNVSVTQAKLDQLWLFMFSIGDDLKTMENFVKAQDAVKTAEILNISANINNITVLTSDNQREAQSTKTGILTLIIIVLLVMATGITGTLIYVYRKWDAQKRLRLMGAD